MTGPPGPRSGRSSSTPTPRSPSASGWTPARRVPVEGGEQNDSSRAGELWAAADLAVVDLAPAVFVATPASLDLVSARVGNYQRNPQFGILLDEVWVR